MAVEDSRLEGPCVEDAGNLGQRERLGLRDGAGRRDGRDRGQDRLEKRRRRRRSRRRRRDVEEAALDGGELPLLPLALGLTRPHLLPLLVPAARPLRRSRRSRSSLVRTGTGAILDIDPDADNGNLPRGALPHEMRLHGHARAVVEVLARQVEVELLQLVLDALERHGPGALPLAFLGHDLDRRAQVLEGRARGDVREGEGQLRRRDHGEGARDHVDGGLARACGAEGVGGRVEVYPVGRALCTSYIYEWLVMWYREKRRRRGTYNGACVAKVVDLNCALGTWVKRRPVGARGMSHRGGLEETEKNKDLGLHCCLDPLPPFTFFFNIFFNNMTGECKRQGVVRRSVQPNSNKQANQPGKSTTIQVIEKDPTRLQESK